MATVEYLYVILLALFSGFSTLAGIFIASYLGNSKRIVPAGLGFSTGIMLLISFFDIMPAAFAQTGFFSLVYFLFGVAVIAALNYLLPHAHTHGRAKICLKSTAYLCFIGFMLHDFPEGFAVANSYVISAGLGIYIAIMIALHNIPEGFAMGIPAKASGMGKKELWQISIFAGLAEPVGAIVGLLLLGLIPAMIDVLLPIAAGAMVFIALHELYPIARSYRDFPRYLAGIIISVIFYIIVINILPN